MAEGSRPIFIVGPSRSGTELTRRILNNHSQIGVAGETHYFDDLRPRLGGGTARLDQHAKIAAIAYFAAVQQHSYGLHVGAAETALDPSIIAEAEAAGGSGDAYFAAYCSRFAASQGKSIWGEKTPRHIFAADGILAAFPSARIIALVRDPRAVVASYRDWRNRWFAGQEIESGLKAAIASEQARVRASYSLPVISLLWAAAARQAARLGAQYSGRVFVLKFEDLLSAPEVTTRNLLNWLNLAYEPSMLDVDVVNSSYVDRGARGGIDGLARERWREQLSPKEAGLVSLLTGRAARRFGYVASDPPPLTFTLATVALTPVFALRAAAANRGRIGAILPYLAARAGALLGR
ncbi:MAG: sulfotransferase [Phenylobacterium sp.]|uniref:sulfotransferase family protein n=1 Tax=Phenylobacterium sp. TaxID=1871053 RepID=UPI001A335809|nr:sulfotransferase [Phenylobacterium sp.]MBJ7413126.1 sulfotransferase [Phenylobacterium sp.]